MRFVTAVGCPPQLAGHKPCATGPSRVVRPGRGPQGLWTFVGDGRTTTIADPTFGVICFSALPEILVGTNASRCASASTAKRCRSAPFLLDPCWLRQTVPVGRMLLRAGVLVACMLSVASCSHVASLPDPFPDSAVHARVVSDRVDCPMGPESCSRYVVLQPAGVTVPQLLGEVSAYALHKLSWRKVSPPPVSVRQYGTDYDGPTDDAGNDYGGYVASASHELAVWRRERFAEGSTPPDRPALATQAAMARTPNGVFFELLGSMCGTVEQCSTS